MNIEWRHLDIEGKTCARCSATGKTLRDLVKELSDKMIPRGINVTLNEVLLPDG